MYPAAFQISKYATGCIAYTFVSFCHISFVAFVVFMFSAVLILVLLFVTNFNAVGAVIDICCIVILLLLLSLLLVISIATSLKIQLVYPISYVQSSH